MNVAYIFLATIFYIATPDIKENLYSWQITFNSFDPSLTTRIGIDSLKKALINLIACGSSQRNSICSEPPTTIKQS